MKRNTTALKTIALLIGFLAPATVHAGTMEDAILKQLSEQGFSEFEVEHTFLGRVRIVAVSRRLEREIVLNPANGEIMRDYWVNRPSAAPAPTTANPTIIDPRYASNSAGSTNQASTSSSSTQGSATTEVTSASSGSSRTSGSDSGSVQEDDSGQNRGGGNSRSSSNGQRDNQNNKDDRGKKSDDNRGHGHGSNGKEDRGRR